MDKSMMRGILISILLARFFVPPVLCAQDAHDSRKMHAANRKALLGKIDGAAAVIMRGAERVKGHDQPFRQNSNFYYLTGYTEPGAAVLLLPGKKDPFILFVQPRAPGKVLWDGKRYGTDEAITQFQADAAYPMDQMDQMLLAYLADVDRVYCDFGDKALMRLLADVLRQVSEEPRLSDIAPLLQRMRVVKNEMEIQRIRKAVDITCAAHRKVMGYLGPGTTEHEIAGLIDYVYAQNGSTGTAFTSIVASGPNALTLHYSHNDGRAGEGDLLLLDIGADFGHYAADVTRTIPVSGSYTEDQKALYEIVLTAQQEAIETIEPGVLIDRPATVIHEVLGRKLQKLGLVSDPNSAWQVRVWQMHGTSHWLGLDVHDAGPYSFREPEGAVFEPGMVLTVEPGVYVSQHVIEHLDVFFPHVAEDERRAFLRFIRPAFRRYRDIGIRIEDDILVTPDGHTVLSSGAPKDIRSIESLMATPEKGRP